MGKETSIQISFTEYENISELDDLQQSILEMAKAISETAYAPYSDFQVGAAIAVEDKIVIGNNQENRAYPSGLCAERVAIFSAAAQNPNSTIDSIAIYAGKGDEISPCGACRQVMLEYEDKQGSEIEVLLMNHKGRCND